MEQYGSEVQEGKTLVLVDKTLVAQTPKHSLQILGIEATRLAEEEFQDRVVANMIMLGAMAALTGWLRLETLDKALNSQVSARTLKKSKSALKRGFELGCKMRVGKKETTSKGESQC